MFTRTNTKLRTVLNLHETKNYEVGINILSDEKTQDQRGRLFLGSHSE